jgi:hypothetical protein
VMITFLNSLYMVKMPQKLFSNLVKKLWNFVSFVLFVWHVIQYNMKREKFRCHSTVSLKTKLSV